MSTVSYELKDICKIRSGKRLPKGTDFSNQVTDYKYIRARDIKDGKINGSDLVYISEEIHNKLSRYIVNTDDIVITIVGASVGDVAYVTDEFDGINLTENAVRLTEFDTLVNSKYLMYILNSKKYWELMQHIAGGAAQPKLGIYKIESIVVDLPERKTQNKVVDILSAYDNLIENNQKQIKLLEEAAQRLYKEWFVDLRFPGCENTPIIDGVPQGWEFRKLDTFGEIITGKTPSTAKESYYNGGIPFVKIPDMHNTIYPIITESTLSEEGANTQKNKFIPKDSLMVSCIATVGLVNISIQNCQTNQQINSIILNSVRDLYYLYFSTKGLKMLLDGVGSNGATMTNVNKSKFANIEVFYPTNDLCEMFYGFCKPIFEKILVLSKSTIELKNSRDQLLPKLMSGELEV